MYILWKQDTYICNIETSVYIDHVSGSKYMFPSSGTYIDGHLVLYNSYMTFCGMRQFDPKRDMKYTSTSRLQAPPHHATLGSIDARSWMSGSCFIVMIVTASRTSCTQSVIELYMILALLCARACLLVVADNGTIVQHMILNMTFSGDALWGV